LEPTTNNRLLTIPNVLTVIRLLGSLGLVGLALAQESGLFLTLFLVLGLTDWVDGQLAVWLDQCTTLGARLDSIADVTMYTALVYGAVVLKGEDLQGEWPYIVAALGSYPATVVAAQLKFRRHPSYHTRAAKTSGVLIWLAAIALFTNWSLWPLRIALWAVVLTNVEMLLITLALRRWQADVPSVLHAWRAAREH
jgi:CDP-diacylglycerol--glycerol-3-phosphate 3-phosphatidyltransferase